MNDSIRRLLEQQEKFDRMVKPFGALHEQLTRISDTYRYAGLGSETLRFLQSDTQIQKLMAGMPPHSALAVFGEEAERQRKLLEGPLEQARRIGLLDPHSNVRQAMTGTSEAHSAYSLLFRLPAEAELTRLAGAAASLGAFPPGLDALSSAMASIHTPWLSIEHASQSAKAVANLLAVGHSVGALPPFDVETAIGLRQSLGDWRDTMTFTHDHLINPIYRSGLYFERGVDPTLTEFPLPAFAETLRAAGLEDEEDLEDADQQADDDDGFALARAAFEKLQRFEVAIRRFIERVMEEAFGTDWIKRQVPPHLRDAWMEKREKALKSGQPEYPLIDYADFTDYRIIIEKSDNWNTVFKHVFGRPEDIRESLQRLYPVRIATMHARIVTADDSLLLLSETKRVLRAIGH